MLNTQLCLGLKGAHSTVYLLGHKDPGLGLQGAHSTVYLLGYKDPG